MLFNLIQIFLEVRMKSLLLALLIVVALSGPLVTGQRKGASTLVAPDPSLILQEEKPFVAPCGVKPKLEANCAKKSAADKKVYCKFQSFSTALSQR